MESEQLKFKKPNTEELIRKAKQDIPLKEDLKRFLKNTKYLSKEILSKEFQI